jgi:aspartyl-tRNA(Asn)/glutamyl-tRNA(Gln) amidotransferase subunit B
VKRAIEAEVERLIEITERNEPILQQTRSFDADKGTTFSLRSKEEADDYRYFPEPDLPPFYISDKHIEDIKQRMPVLPAALQQNYKESYGLSAYDAAVICSDKDDAAFYEDLIKEHQLYKPAANWMLGPLKAWCNETNISLREFPLPASKVAELISFTESGKVSFNMASTRILPAMIAAGGGDPLAIATRMNLIQESDESTVEQWVKETLAAMPDKVKEYQAGKKALIGLFAGQVKKLSNGKAAMPLVNKILEQQLKQ